MRGTELADLLPLCRVWDVLICKEHYYGRWVEGKEYPIYEKEGGLYLVDETGQNRNSAGVGFVKKQDHPNTDVGINAHDVLTTNKDLYRSGSQFILYSHIKDNLIMISQERAELIFHLANDNLFFSLEEGTKLLNRLSEEGILSGNTIQ